MTQTIDEGRAQLIANLQEQAEELAQLNRIAIALTSDCIFVNYLFWR